MEPDLVMANAVSLSVGTPLCLYRIAYRKGCGSFISRAIPKNLCCVEEKAFKLKISGIEVYYTNSQFFEMSS